MAEYDYAPVRTALLDAIMHIETARDAAGRTNLYPTMAPADARQQIDALDALLDDARAEVDAARRACVTLARRGLTIAGGAAAE